MQFSPNHPGGAGALPCHVVARGPVSTPASVLALVAIVTVRARLITESGPPPVGAGASPANVVTKCSVLTQTFLLALRSVHSRLAFEVASFSSPPGGAVALPSNRVAGFAVLTIAPVGATVPIETQSASFLAVSSGVSGLTLAGSIHGVAIPFSAVAPVPALESPPLLRTFVLASVTDESRFTLALSTLLIASSPVRTTARFLALQSPRVIRTVFFACGSGLSRSALALPGYPVAQRAVRAAANLQTRDSPRARSANVSAVFTAEPGGAVPLARSRDVVALHSFLASALLPALVSVRSLRALGRARGPGEARLALAHPVLLVAAHRVLLLARALLLAPHSVRPPRTVSLAPPAVPARVAVASTECGVAPGSPAPASPLALSPKLALRTTVFAPFTGNAGRALALAVLRVALALILTFALVLTVRPEPPFRAWGIAGDAAEPGVSSAHRLIVPARSVHAVVARVQALVPEPSPFASRNNGELGEV